VLSAVNCYFQCQVRHYWSVTAAGEQQAHVEQMAGPFLAAETAGAVCYCDHITGQVRAACHYLLTLMPCH
jgi:hypothetical protein